MTTSRYNFYEIFDYDQTRGILIPKFNITVNGMRYNKGVLIAQSSLMGNLNLFNYIGHGIAGTWDVSTFVLNILGFY